MIQRYRVPYIGAGSFKNAFRAKYFQSDVDGRGKVPAFRGPWRVVVEQEGAWFLIEADLSPEEHARLAGFADVIVEEI